MFSYLPIYVFLFPDTPQLYKVVFIGPDSWLTIEDDNDKSSSKCNNKARASNLSEVTGRTIAYIACHLLLYCMLLLTTSQAYHGLSSAVSHHKEKHVYDLQGLYTEIAGFFEIPEFNEYSTPLLQWWNEYVCYFPL